MQAANYFSLCNCASPFWNKYHCPCLNTAFVLTADTNPVMASKFRPIKSKKHKLQSQKLK